MPYALAVKYNYGKEDRAVLIDYIAMIKGTLFPILGFRGFRSLSGGFGGFGGLGVLGSGFAFFFYILCVGF
jgi:hypothetical protein